MPLVVLVRNRTFRRDTGQCAFRRNACHVRRAVHLVLRVVLAPLMILLVVVVHDACRADPRSAPDLCDGLGVPIA